MFPCVPDGSVDKHVYHECKGSWVQTPWKAALVLPCRNGLFNDLTLNLKDVFSTSSYMLVSLMAQWISTCTMSVKVLGFKSHGRLQCSFAQVLLQLNFCFWTWKKGCYLVLPTFYYSFSSPIKCISSMSQLR